MNKITLLAIAVTGVISSSSAAFAEEGMFPLDNGEAILIAPNGSAHKSTTNVSIVEHQAALAQGARELSRGAMIDRHQGKLYGSNCVGSYIGDWKHGYPGTENDC